MVEVMVKVGISVCPRFVRAALSAAALQRKAGGAKRAARLCLPWGGIYLRCKETNIDQGLLGRGLQVFCTQGVEALQVFSPGLFIQRFLAQDELHDVLAVETD